MGSPIKVLDRKYLWVLTALLAIFPPLAMADIRELIAEEVLLQIAEETSGEAAKRNLDTITLQHRMRASKQFEITTQHIVAQLKHYALDEIAVLEYAADGKTMYGTQKSRPVWDVRFAQLWEVRDSGGELIRVRKLGDWDSVPLTLAQDSLSADVTTSLIDIGTGMQDSEFEGKDIKGKLVLTSSQPGAVVDRAVGEHGAAGIISYAPNQKSAWWKEDDRLIRWGHMGSFPETKSFGFMISLGEARALQQRLLSGETIFFHARVDARHERGKYGFATAAIVGTEKSGEDIHLTCHLDHPRPSANDNASGCVAILEVARTLSALIKDGILPRPLRTIRFLWPAEIEGSIMYLAEHENPSRIKANIHMDMVGGGPVTKSVFRISGGPYSVPSFISDLGHEIGRFVNDQSKRYADGEDVAFPLVAPEGGKEPQLALMEGLDMGSDHDVFFEGTWHIPGLYLHDWPDRYIHTNYDLAANIDPTKLKRAAFIGAVSAWYLANFSDDDVPAVMTLLQRNALQRSAVLAERRAQLPLLERAAATRTHFALERRKVHSVEPFATLPENDHKAAVAYLDKLQELLATPEPRIMLERNERVYERNPDIEGPMHGFDYSYIDDKLGEETAANLQLANHSTQYGGGGMFTYEALNLVDGKRTVSDIRDWLVAELGDVPLPYVAEYLQALESINVLRRQ
jgi:aminopeptidase YwaD